MSIAVQFYGRLAEVLGAEISINNCADIHRIADLRRVIAAAHPALAADMMSPRVQACVGDQIVRDAQTIGDGVVVAFFPPLSGG